MPDILTHPHGVEQLRRHSLVGWPFFLHSPPDLITICHFPPENGVRSSLVLNRLLIVAEGIDRIGQKIYYL